jgi:hypothetical protein
MFMATISQHHKKTRLVAVAALVVGVLGLGVAFAALSTALLISGTAKIESASWSVLWTGKSVQTPAPSCTATGEASVASTPAITDGSGSSSNTDTVLTISPSFKTGGDTVTCTFTAKNTGSIAAKLGTINPSTSNLATNNITAALTYANGNTPAAGDALAVAATQGYKLVFTYNGSTVSAEIDNITYTITVPYVQASQ